jgi:ubiquinone/menaquinone biosynthesis C-methylase UbiE
MKKFLRLIKRILDKIFGTSTNEFYWRFRHIITGDNWPQSYISQSSISHPHRQLLIEKITGYAPFKTVLEIGCASGPNLYLLSKRFPEAKLYGTDISNQAIKIGRMWFRTQNIQNILLLPSRAEDLKQFPDKSIDVIFTDAVLIYIGPNKIENVIQEMIRVARKVLVLNEWHDGALLYPFYDDHWIYNYQSLLVKFHTVKDIKLTKIPPEIWEGNWAKYGYIIEAMLNP